MASPFPGMDPYLEAHWRDVHARLIIYASDALQVLLPGSLRAASRSAFSWKRRRGLATIPCIPMCAWSNTHGGLAWIHSAKQVLPWPNRS